MSKCTNHTAIAHEIDLHFVRTIFSAHETWHLKEHTLPSQIQPLRTWESTLESACAWWIWSLTVPTKCRLLWLIQRKRTNREAFWIHRFFVSDIISKPLEQPHRFRNVLTLEKNLQFESTVRRSRPEPKWHHFRIHYVLRLPILRVGVHSRFLVPPVYQNTLWVFPRIAVPQNGWFYNWKPY